MYYNITKHLKFRKVCAQLEKKKGFCARDLAAFWVHGLRLHPRCVACLCHVFATWFAAKLGQLTEETQDGHVWTMTMGCGPSMAVNGAKHVTAFSPSTYLAC